MASSKSAIARRQSPWRSAIRPHFRDPSDGTNGYAHALVTPERYASLRAAAKGLGVTTNDLLLALLVHAVMPIAACRHHTGRRRQIALASIVNVRGDYQPPATEVFGQFLSSFRIVHPFVEGRPIADTARDVFRQTRRAKDAKLYLAAIDDTWTRRANLDMALEARPDATPCVLLAHDPDRFPLAVERDVDLRVRRELEPGAVGQRERLEAAERRGVIGPQAPQRCFGPASEHDEHHGSRSEGVRPSAARCA